MTAGGVGVLDVLLGLLLAAYAVSGWRQGFLRAGFTLVGFLGGGALAMWVLPHLLRRWPALDDRSLLRSLTIIGFVLIVAALGQLIGTVAGHRLAERVESPFGRILDGALGAVAVVLAAALLIWFVAGAVRGSTLTTVARAIGESRVIGAIDSVVPARTGNLFVEFERTLTDRGFPKVFDGLSREPIKAVEPPGVGIAAAPEVKRARGSVVRLDALAPTCGEQVEGTGWVLAPGRVVTNAHVVAGSSSVAARVGGTGPRYPARVVLLDPLRDLAVLDVPGLPAPPLRLGGDLSRGQEAAALGFPLGGPYSVASARLRATLEAKGADIYGRIGPVREVYSLRATIRPGNSGGPLVDSRGRVVGVIFAASIDDPDTGYALTLDEVRSDLAKGAGRTTPVSTGACARG